MDQRNWVEYGDEVTEALAELVGFEKSFRPALERKVDERDKLEAKAENLGVKIGAEKIELGKKKTVFFADLREREAKIKSDLAKELATPPAPGKKPVHYPDDFLERAVADRLEPKVKDLLAMRGRALGILKMERDHAALMTEICVVAEWPFRQRREAARKFALSLLQVAGLEVKYQQTDSSFGQTSTWSQKMKELEERIAVAEGRVKHFNPLHFQADSADGILEFGFYLPEDAMPQLLRAWRTVKLAGGKAAALTFDGRRVLKWRFRRSRVVDQPRIISTSDYSSGSTDSHRAALGA